LPLYFIYMFYTAALGVIAIILVPKSSFKTLAFHSIFFGALYDVFWIILIGLTGAGGYINYGPFGFSSIPFFPPIAWTIFFIMFFYLLPENTLWSFLFALVGALYSMFFSNILQNLGIFVWNYGDYIVPFIIYFVWLTSATFIYRRYVIKDRNL